MASAVLTLPEKVKDELKSFSWINWSEVARDELLRKSEREVRFEKFDKMLKNSELTDELASKLADELKKRQESKGTAKKKPKKKLKKRKAKKKKKKE